MVKALLKGSLAVVSLAIVIAGCGSDGEGGGNATPTPTLSTPATATPTMPTPTMSTAPTLTPTPHLSTRPGPLGPPPCEEAGQRACNNHSTLYAIAHSYNDPQNTILYRVNVAAWGLGTGWQGGRNGLFYRATVSGGGSICVNPQSSSSCSSTKVYVPFNGVGFDPSQEEPELPAFSFIVPVTEGTSSTTVTIEACFTNYAGSSSDAQPPCTALGWSDVYGGSDSNSLPTPSVGFPTGFISSISPDLVDTTTASVPTTGVYPGVLVVQPSDTTLDATSLDFFYEHLVFVDQNGNPYTNDIFDGSSTTHRSMGVLPIDEAAYPVSNTDYRPKYGGGSVTRATDPGQKQFFFYTADQIASTPIKVGVAYIYDLDGCFGNLSGAGSNDSCSGFLTTAASGAGAGLPSGFTQASITPVNDAANEITLSQASGQTAGEREHRSLKFDSSNGVCSSVVNPLAAPLGGGRYGMPNYVIRRTIDNTRSWRRDFPKAMYFVLPTAFGNCDSNDAPFCERPTGTTAYDAYVPHYLDTGEPTGTGGELNGGSTDAALVGSLTLADQYTLGAAGQADQNSLLYFDNCGYGYLYAEGGDSGVTLGTRKTLPQAPNDGDTYTYRITNNLDDPIVFGKDCCASDYRENMDDFGNTYLEPQVELDNGFGVFVGAGNTVTYRTFFNAEGIVIYNAVTGERLAKMRLNEAGGALYSCNDSSLAVQASAETDTSFDVGIGADSADALKCRPVGECPFGTQVSLEGTNIVCTLSTSSFLIGLPEWAQALGPSVPVQLRAWGGRGEDVDGTSGEGGRGGFAATAISSDQLTDTLYAYVGKRGDAENGNGGSSTVLTNTPLSSLGDPAGVTDPSTVGVLLVAGGGGGAGGDQTGSGKSGGAGGVAIADTSGAKSSAGENAGSEGGLGGNQNTEGMGEGDGENGIGGNGGGGVNWRGDGSLVPPKDYSAGKGDGGTNGCGGGGFGGGARDRNNGGGGGGTWAAQATIDASLPDAGNPPLSPNAHDGAVQFIHTDFPSGPPADCFTEETTKGRLDGVCTITTGSVFDVGDFVALFSPLGVTESSTMWIQAWGGRGGKGTGTDKSSGGYHGKSGFAQTITSVNQYRNRFQTQAMYVYLGSQGSSDNKAGKGGAATIVSSQDLTKVSAVLELDGTQLTNVNIVLIAAGGGGGGQGQSSNNGKDGGDGGVAIASTSNSATGHGQDGGDDKNSGGRGAGGMDGVGGDGGGSSSSHNGHDGVGGYGGSVNTGGSQSTTEGWTNTTPTTVGDNGGGGSGGNGDGGQGGGGGGGWGGGGGGNGGSSNSDSGGGGGGGGSFAERAARSDDRAPTSRPSAPSNAGVVRIVFPGLSS